MRGRALIIVAAALSACEGPLEVFEGEHVVVRAEPGFDLCGGTMAHMDEFVARLAAEMQQAPPTGDERIEFRWYPGEHWALLPCRRSAFGCARGDEVFSVLMPHNHELVHALASERSRRALPFFAEGLAEGYQGLHWQADGLTELPLGQAKRVQDELGGGPAELGLASVGFVRLLVQQHGMAKFLALYSLLSRRSSVTDVDEALRTVLGVSLDESIAAFEALPADCIRPQLDPKLLECSAPALEWDDSRLAVFRMLDCSQDDAVGPYDGDHLQVLHTLTVREPGTFELRAIAERPDEAVSLNAVVMTPCSGCGGGPPIRVLARERARADLAAGRYSLRWMGPAAVPTTLGFLLERVDASEPGGP
ncbi:hypothetical protein [Nannocystis pusilla]|uniref:Lipoprotein n=1 Tax=Nannocystis pusilla TaxID=889268 RepID=A0ABS7U387_9BACT|nr:hypothetical protein [Nannocystis pusilla]MBZ5715005.1 hypothetical protein [Nannocystis pusilla]